MATLKTIIVDDEPLALDLLANYLSKFSTIELMKKCRNGREALEACTSLQPDLMLIDIQMPGLTGIDVASRLQSDVLPMIVFVTAYDEYAVKAFDLHAVDYLLKPIDHEKLGRAIERCIERMKQHTEMSNKAPIMGAVHSLSKSSEIEIETDASTDKFPKIVVKDRGTITIIDQPEIDWIDAAGDYVCIHVEGVTHIMRNTMKGIIDQLDPTLFQRVHRSTIVNLTRIQKVIPHTKGECFLDLGGAEQIKVSRNYRAVIQNYLNKIR